MRHIAPDEQERLAMLQRRIWWAFLLVLAVGIAVSGRIVTLGDSVQAVNRMFIAEKLPLSQRIGELRGIIADEERILYEYYSYTATRDAFLAQRKLNAEHLADVVGRLEQDMGAQGTVAELRARLTELDQLSGTLDATLSGATVNWDLARAILAQVKPKVRQIETTLADLSSANRQAVDSLGEDSQSSVSNMVGWVFGFSVLIIVVALFVAYYVVAITRAEEKLKYQAFFDLATGLPNQYRLRDDLGAAYTQQRAGTVMMIVADREQEIFESFGAVETERWLVKVAQRLGGEIDAGEEILYRFGGNAFVLVRRSGDLADAQRRAGQLLHSAQQPLQVNGHELLSTLSIGAALMECDGCTDAASMAEALVQKAVSACNRVRRAGGNDFAVYDEAMGQAAARTLRLATDLQHAVENGELRLQYQPKVDAVSGRLLGMEALVRWIHPERGMISPMEFIPIAEDTGLIVAIGRWVLREACRQNAEWQRAGLRPLRVAVNLSARQFRSGKLLDEIDAALADTGLPVNLLELEITESMVMDDPEGVIELLNALHERGIHLALDDFGTGHSSLAYLKRFPIDCVKIDRAFVKDTPGNTDDVAIAKTIMAMAQALGLTTVAEGVETAEQLELLNSLGCDQIQGYFFSRPLPPEEFLDFCRTHAAESVLRRYHGGVTFSPACPNQLAGQESY
jgi:EAL domain-containing protein (putative c-di-GMP-specific phosphodiesterase class I)/GGDEF domain-containing protein